MPGNTLKSSGKVEEFYIA